MLGRYTTGPRPADGSRDGTGLSPPCLCPVAVLPVVACLPAGIVRASIRAGESGPGSRPVRAGPARRPTPILAAMRQIDLRSDTVTHPSPAMRRAMADAPLGDDVFGDDPTVNALEERAAALLGKEAGLFVASGTMGNLVAQMAHLGRGQETIASAESHIVMDEAAGHAVIVGTSIRPIPDRSDGTMDPQLVDAAFRDPADPHEPISGLVAIENTHAHSMARPLTVDYTREVAAIAHRHGVPMHVDGARFFNAVVALGVTPAQLAGPADSVTFCLSKGLAAPIGSVVVGSKDFVWRARRARKMVGGGMRQVGVLAAAGLVALSDGPDGMIGRLAEDHVNARRLAEGLADLRGIESPGGTAQPTEGRLDPGRACTNFVVFRIAGDRAVFLDALAARGVLMVAYPHGTVRAVTHYGITAADVDATIEAVREVLAGMASTEAATGRRPGGASGPRRRTSPARPPEPRVLVIPSIDLAGGRSRIVHWPGAAAGIGSPTDRPEMIADRFVAQGARMIHLVDFDGAQRGQPVNLEAVGRVASRVAVPLQVAGGMEGADNIRLAFAAGATRAVVGMALVDDHPTLRACLEVAGDWLGVGIDPRPERFRAYPWRRPRPPTFDEVASELVGLGVRRLVLSHGGAEPDLGILRSLVHDLDVEVLVAGGVTDLAALQRLRDAGVAGVILGETLLSGRIDYPAAVEIAA